MTIKQEETVAKLGSLLGRGISTIVSKNANDNFAQIAERDRIGAPIKFYAVNTIKIKKVELISTTDGAEMIQLNNDPKLMFSMNHEFDPYTDATKLPSDKATMIDDGFYTNPIVAGEIATALNRESKTRIETISKSLLADLGVIEQVIAAEEAAIAAEKARRASNV